MSWKEFQLNPWAKLRNLFDNHTELGDFYLQKSVFHNKKRGKDSVSCVTDFADKKKTVFLTSQISLAR